MSATTVRVERDGPIVTITLERSEQLNSLTQEMLDTVRQAIEDASEHGVRAIVLTGTGTAFCAGADLADILDHDPRDLMMMATTLVTTFRSADVPIVAAINGSAVGYGVSLIAAADLAVAAESASALLTFTAIGVVPDGGLTHTLGAAIGPALAADLALTGRRLDAYEMQTAGLVSRVVPDSACLSTALAMAQAIAERPRDAITLTKRALHAGGTDQLTAALGLEARYQVELLGRPEFAELTDRFRR